MARAVTEIVLPRRAHAHLQLSGLIGPTQDTCTRPGEEAAPALQLDRILRVASAETHAEIARCHAAHQAPYDNAVQMQAGAVRLRVAHVNLSVALLNPLQIPDTDGELPSHPPRKLRMKLCA